MCNTCTNIWSYSPTLHTCVRGQLQMQSNVVNTRGVTFWMTTAASGYCLFPIIIARKSLQLENLMNT